MIARLLDLYIVIQSIYAIRQECCKGVNNMMKIKISYTTDEEQARFINTITKGFKIVKLSKEIPGKKYRNRYLELQ